MISNKFIKELIRIGIQNDEFELKKEYYEFCLYFSVDKYRIKFVEGACYFYLYIDEVIGLNKYDGRERETKKQIFKHRTETKFFVRFGKYASLARKINQIVKKEQNKTIENLVKTNEERLIGLREFVNDSLDDKIKIGDKENVKHIRQKRQGVSGISTIKKFLFEDKGSN